MSQENVESLRRVLEAFNGGRDAKLAEDLVEPEAGFEPLLAGVEGATYREPEGIMRWVAELNEIFAEVRAEYSRVEDLGDVILVTGKTTGRSRGSGVPVEQHWFVATRFRRGKIAYAGFFRTRAEALEAAGGRTE